MITLSDPHPALRLWSEEAVQHLDIRDFLRQKGRPYNLLMDAVRQLTAGEALVIHVLFDPQPLRKQFRRLGLEETCQQVGEDHFELSVRRPA